MTKCDELTAWERYRQLQAASTLKLTTEPPFPHPGLVAPAMEVFDRLLALSPDPFQSTALLHFLDSQERQA